MLRTVPVEPRAGAGRISWAPSLILRVGAETVQWLNRLRPGDFCPGSLCSGCCQRHRCYLIENGVPKGELNPQNEGE